VATDGCNDVWTFLSLHMVPLLWLSTWLLLLLQVWPTWSKTRR
jgi:hypothetical protein